MHLFDDDAAALARTSSRESESIRAPDAGVAPAAGAPQTAASLLHLQRAVGNSGVVQLMADRDEDPHKLQSVLGGGGSPLDVGTRVQMETAIGADFSDVRVHTGADADQSAKSLGAHAYTTGNNVVFAQGKYDPSSDGGQRTLAHELTHVVQQRSGPVSGELTGTGVRVSDPSDSFEQAAEANAERVMSEPAAPAMAPAAAPAGAVQREDEESVQGLFVQRDAESVQREGAPEEEEEPVQGLFAQRDAESVQREGAPEEEEEPVQGLFVQRDAESVQREGAPEEEEEPVQGLFVQRDAESVQREGDEEEEAG